MTAPDFVEPLVGYRAWRLEAGGKLVPWSAGREGTWVPGVNTAACRFDPRARDHAPPGPRCTCGLYAVADAADRRLRPASEAVGAIVAWGDVEVHRTGFRAQHAAIVALALPTTGSAGHRHRLRTAAAHYGVPLIAPDALAAAALEHGRPVEFSALPPRPRVRPDGPGPPPLGEAGPSGIALDQHLRVAVRAGALRIGLTGALAAEAGPAAALGLPRLGAVVRRGDPLVRIGGGPAGLVLGAPVTGQVTALDPAPGELLDLAPSHWESEGADLTWGRVAARLYAAELATAARRGDPFATVRSHWLLAHASIRSAGDVVAAFHADRRRPQFASEREVYERLGGRLERVLADPAVARRVSRMPLRVRWRLHEPDADVTIDLTGREPRLELGPSESAADLVIFASAATAEDYFSGKIDLPAAFRRRQIQTAAPLSALLRAESVLRALHPATSPGVRFTAL